MNTLVIHPKDYTTDFLSVIYKEHDWTIINHEVAESKLKELIATHERIVMLGHGTSEGLLGSNGYVINANFVDHLKEKDCVCIWCNANVFINKYGLNGFYTGMIISELEEAMFCQVNTTQEEIEQSNSIFGESVKQSIESDDMLFRMKELYQGNSMVIHYNKMNLYFNYE